MWTASPSKSFKRSFQDISFSLQRKSFWKINHSVMILLPFSRSCYRAEMIAVENSFFGKLIFCRVMLSHLSHSPPHSSRHSLEQKLFKMSIQDVFRLFRLSREYSIFHRVVSMTFRTLSVCWRTEIAKSVFPSSFCFLSRCKCSPFDFILFLKISSDTSKASIFLLSWSPWFSRLTFAAAVVWGTAKLTKSGWRSLKT